MKKKTPRHKIRNMIIHVCKRRPGVGSHGDKKKQQSKSACRKPVTSE